MPRRPLGLRLDGADMRRSTLIDGRTWDGSDPAGYARSFPIHALAETGQGIDLLTLVRPPCCVSC